MRFADVPIGMKIVVVLLLPLAVLGGAAAHVRDAADALRAAIAAEDASQALEVRAETLAAILYRQQSAVRGYLLTGDEGELAPYRAGDASLRAAAAGFGRTAQADRAARLIAAASAWRARADEQIALSQDRRTRRRALAMTAEVRQTEAEALQAEIADSQRAESRARGAVRAQAGDRLVDRLILGGGGIGGALLAAALLLHVTVARPGRRLADAAARLAGGQIDREIKLGPGRDAFARTGQAMAALREVALDRRRLEAEAEALKVQAEAERQQYAAARAEAEAARAAAVEALGEGLARLRRGDLRHRISASLAPGYAVLRDDFNGAATRLEEIVAVLAEAGDAIHADSDGAARAAEALAEEADRQSAAVRRTTEAVDTVAGVVHRTAEGARHAHAVVSGAKADAERSGEIVREAVSAMGQIEQSSKQIGQIIGVIDEIAFQTNLLALNAGVEAARAGEAGKGFAVVASEVRALAQRSAEAAKEIKSLIGASTEQVGQGVNLVGETGKALERIVAQVSEINAAVAEIAASAHAQDAGLRDVNAAVAQMQAVTDRTASAIAEGAAAAGFLAGEAGELSRLLGKFQVGSAADEEADEPLSVRRLKSPSPLRALDGGRTAEARPPSPRRRSAA